MPRTSKEPVASLFRRIAGGESLELKEFTEDAWIDVVRKMDDVYADLVRYETDLENKNQALEGAHDFISGVLSSMFDVLIACDAQGRIRQANRALIELTGIPEKDLKLRPLEDIFAPESRELATSLLVKARHEVVKDCELTLAGRLGPAPLAVNCTPRRDRRNRFTGAVLCGRPVGELRRAYDALNDAHRELKRTQQQLIHSEKLATIGRLVAGVAHELNNPISFVYSNVHTLRKYAERIREYLEAAQSMEVPVALKALRGKLRLDRVLSDLEPLINGTLEGAVRVRDIVNDLRRYSSTPRGQPEPVKIRDVIESAVRWATQGSGRQADIAVDVDPECTVMGHEGPLHQVAVNLLQNALDAVEKSVQPRLWIGARTNGERVTLSFEDNGSGIPADNFTRIFDPFFTTKSAGKGTGLGLSISEAIVRDHGGSIEVTNRPGGGAVFAISLPVPPIGTRL